MCLANRENFIYLIGIIYPFGELHIMGIYTSKQMLIEAYEKLMQEDARCSDIKYPAIPEIYKIPLNKFLGKKVPWVSIDEEPYFYENDNIEELTIDEVKSHVKIASFYGINVYCDLHFKDGAYIDLEYTGGDADDYCWIQMNIESGTCVGAYNYLQETLKSWYQDNRSYLLEIYGTGKLVAIPKWE